MAKKISAAGSYTIADADNPVTFKDVTGEVKFSQAAFLRDRYSTAAT